MFQRIAVVGDEDLGVVRGLDLLLRLQLVLNLLKHLGMVQQVGMDLVVERLVFPGLLAG